jgi:hypothetical protein
MAPKNGQPVWDLAGHLFGAKPSCHPARPAHGRGPRVRGRRRGEPRDSWHPLWARQIERAPCLRAGEKTSAPRRGDRAQASDLRCDHAPQHPRHDTRLHDRRHGSGPHPRRARASDQRGRWERTRNGACPPCRRARPVTAAGPQEGQAHDRPPHVPLHALGTGARLHPDRAPSRHGSTHTAAGLTNLRFTHGQIKYEPAYVEEILRATARYMSSIVSASSPTSRKSV